MRRGAIALFLGGCLLVIGAALFGPAATIEIGLVLVCGAILGAPFIYAAVQNARTPGWTRAVNPGAAYREARAEREARAKRESDALGGGEDPER